MISAGVAGGRLCPAVVAPACAISARPSNWKIAKPISSYFDEAFLSSPKLTRNRRILLSISAASGLSGPIRVSLRPHSEDPRPLYTRETLGPIQAREVPPKPTVFCGSWRKGGLVRPYAQPT